MEPPYFDKKKNDWDDYKNRLWLYFKSRLPKRVKQNRLKIDLIRKAYNQAFISHKNIFRKGGDKAPYITHPVEVALIVANEIKFGTTSIAAALLHDVLEDDPTMDIDTFKDLFGEEITTIVAGVSKITNISGQKEKLNEQMDVFIKMIVTIPKDFRTFIVKVADRLHNMRTMDDMPDQKRRIKSSENLYLYAPMAGIAGLWYIKNELEDRSFKYLNPEEYKNLVQESHIYDTKHKEHLKEIQKDLQQNYFSQTETKIIYEIIEKRSLFNIWNKFVKKGVKYEDVTDRFALRAIMDVPKDIARRRAYELFVRIPENKIYGDIEDHFIRKQNPVFNAFVFYLKYKNKFYEIQLLSDEDHEMSLFGRPNLNEFVGFEHLKQIILNRWDIVKNKDFTIEDFNKIYVETPQGDIIELPQGAVVLDFAFKIHTDLGLKCLAAKVNGKLLKPVDNLKSGMVVEIISSDKATPKETWLEYVVTNQAKRSLKRYFEAQKQAHKTGNNIKVVKGYITINENTKFKLAECCRPQIGEDTSGHIVGDTVVIHKRDCKVLLHHQAIDANNTGIIRWEAIPKDKAILVKVKLEGIDRVGLLSEISRVISNELGINMKELHFINNNGIFDGTIELYVKNNNTANELKNKVKEISYITKVEIIK